MKLSFEIKSKLSPICNRNVPFFLNKNIYSQYNNSIVQTDVETFKIIKKIDFDEVMCFDVFEDYIVVADTNVHIYSLKEDKIIRSIKIGKINISNVKCITGIDDFIVTRIDGNVFHYNTEMHIICKFDGVVKIHLSEDRTLCIYDDRKIVCFSHNKIVLEKYIKNIISVYLSKSIYVITGDMKLIKVEESDTFIETGILMSNILVLNDTVICTDNRFLYFYDKNLTFLKKKNLLNECSVEKFGMDNNMNISEEEDVHSEEGCKENEESMSNSESNAFSYKEKFIITYFSKDFILSSENEIFLLDENLDFKYVFIGNNDEITEIKEEGDVLLVGTNSGRLRYTYKSMYTDGEYVFKGYIVEGHSQIIMSISIYNNMLLTTSQDSFVNLYRFNKQEDLKFKRMKISNELSGNLLNFIATFHCGTIHQNSCALSENFFVVGGDDGIIQFWNFKENIITMKIHEKEINSISINHENKIIATGSQDKKIKILNYEGKVLATLCGHKKGVVSVCFGNKYLASSSIDKTVRIWDIKTFECVAVLEGHDSGVLKCEFYKNDKYLISTSVSGIIKIWDVKRKKCDQSLDIHKDKIWALSTNPEGLIFGTNGVFYLLKDETNSKSIELLEEENKKAIKKLELDRAIRENDYLGLFELLKDTKEYKLMFNGMVKAYENNRVDVLDIFKDYRKTFFQIIISNYKFKNSEVISWMVRYALQNKMDPPKDLIETIDSILTKQVEGIEIIYRDLMSYDIFNK